MSTYDWSERIVLIGVIVGVFLVIALLGYMMYLGIYANQSELVVVCPAQTACSVCMARG